MDSKNSKLFYFSAESNRQIVGLLSNLKQNCFSYRGYQKHLSLLLTSLEEVNKLYISSIQPLYSLNQDYSENHLSYFYRYHESILSFIYLYFQEEATTNSLTDIYLGFIISYLETITEIKNYYYPLHRQYILKIIEVIYNKKLEFTNAVNDSKNLLITTKILFKLVNIGDSYEDLSISSLLNYILNLPQVIFKLSEQLLFEDLTEISLALIKSIFTKKLEESQVIEASESLLSKIIEIAIKKDNLKESQDYSTQAYFLNVLLFSIKSIILIAESGHFAVCFSKLSNLITQSIIHLSFWDNASVTENSCRLIEYFMKEIIKSGANSSKFELEIIIDYFFNKRIKEQYESLSELSRNDKLDSSQEQELDIKLSVLELLVSYLNSLVIESELSIILFLNYDINKINNPLLTNILENLLKFYSLANPHFNYVKELCGNIIKNVITLIHNLKSDANQEAVKELIKVHQTSVDLWNDVICKINDGKYKKLFVLLQQNFGLINTTQPKKKKKKANTPTDTSNNETSISENSQLNLDSIPLVKSDSSLSMNISVHTNRESIGEDTGSAFVEIVARNKELAKIIAIILRYSKLVDVNIIYEVIGNNEDFSGHVLEEYLNTFNFKGMDILSAYRLFVSTFKLGGESFVLYNIILEFSKKFFSDTKGEGVFMCEDQVSTFAYSVLMLNTDLHDPGVKEHMKVEDFIKNNLITGQFNDVPHDFFKSIYKSIQSNPLKIAKSRTAEYSKGSEVFELLDCKKYYSNYISTFQNEEVYHSLSILTDGVLENYPYCLISDRLILGSQLANEHITVLGFLAHNFFEDFFSLFILISSNFYSTATSKVNEFIINKVCETAVLLKRNDFVEKLLSVITRTIQTDKYQTDKQALYNMFFIICINYTTKFNTYLETFFSNLLDLIKLNINKGVEFLHTDYKELLSKLAEDSYTIIYKKKYSKKEGYFGFIFGSSSNDEDFAKGLETFKVQVFKSLKLNYLQKSLPSSQTTSTSSFSASVSKEYMTPRKAAEEELSQSISVCKNNSKPEKSIELSQILNIVRMREDEFPFLLNLASLKIIEYKEISDLCYSIIFLNEIINMDLQEKEFMKIWQNLLNILYNKMELSNNFGEKEHLVFEIILINDFVTTTISKYINYIESQDYYYFLEKYIEIDNIDLIYYILENNNKIVEQPNSINLLKKEQIMDSLIFLFEKFVSQASLNLSNQSNNQSTLAVQSTQKIHSIILFLSKLIQMVPSINYFSSESINLFINILKILKDKKVIDKQYLITLIKSMVIKVQTSEINLIDVKWDLFIQLFNFILGAVMNDNTKVQTDYLFLLNELMNEVKIPMLKFKEITNILNIFYNNAINLKKKADYFWEGVFLLFYNIIKSNQELTNSENDMDSLWNLFIRKYFISFVDFKRQNSSNPSAETESLNILGKIIGYLKEKSKKRIIT